MARGKRTGAILATVLFDEGPNPGEELSIQAPPLLGNNERFERIKEGARRFQASQSDELRLKREKKREFETKQFKEQQKKQMEAIDATLAAVSAKSSGATLGSKPGSVSGVSMDVDAGTSGDQDQRGQGKPTELTTVANEANGSTPSVVESMGGISEFEKATIAHRLRVSQLKLESLARKEKYDKLESIFDVLPHLTEEEAQEALKRLADDEFDVIEEFDRYPELRELRRDIAKKWSEEAKKNRKRVKRTKAAKVTARAPQTVSAASTPRANSEHVSNSASTLDGSQHLDPQLDAIAALLPQGTDLAYERPPLPDIAEGRSAQSSDDEHSNDVDDTYEIDGEGYSMRTHKKKKQITVKKLKLDDAIAQGSMEGWSSARIRAWNLRHENPNAYYYRFNHPGEVQRNGKWTEEERERFFARMMEVGVNGQWGMFAKEIYGRVGYQCANFYRQMIENNEIEDPRYVVDPSGKAHFLFSKKKKKSSSAKTAEDDEEGDEGDMTGSLEGMTKIIKDDREIYIPRILVGSRRADGASKSKAAKAATAKKTSAKLIDKNEGNSSATSAAPPMDDSTSPQQPIAMPPPYNRMELSDLPTPPKTATLPPKKTSAATTPKQSEDSKPRKKPVKKRKREGDGDDAEYKPTSTWTREKVEREAEKALKDRISSNPLPGFKDVITNVEIIQPAISPYGHVLSYSTWLKCLASEPKNTCPFTKKPVKKRDLVLLTHDNIEDFRDRIDLSGQ